MHYERDYALEQTLEKQVPCLHVDCERGLFHRGVVVTQHVASQWPSRRKCVTFPITYLSRQELLADLQNIPSRIKRMGGVILVN